MLYKTKLNAIKYNDFKLKKVLKDYGDLFMDHKWDIGKTELVKHEIRTNKDPIQINPRRQKYIYKGKLRKTLRKCLKRELLKNVNLHGTHLLFVLRRKNQMT